MVVSRDYIQSWFSGDYQKCKLINCGCLLAFFFDLMCLHYHFYLYNFFLLSCFSHSLYFHWRGADIFLKVAPMKTITRNAISCR